MISERSCDIEDRRVMMLKIQLCAAENKIIIIPNFWRCTEEGHEIELFLFK